MIVVRGESNGWKWLSYIWLFFFYDCVTSRNWQLSQTDSDYNDVNKAYGEMQSTLNGGTMKCEIQNNDSLKKKKNKKKKQNNQNSR